MKIPVVLPALTVCVNADGHLTATLDDVPIALDRELGRQELPSLVCEATQQTQSPIRVTVGEADGTTYTDIALPTETTEDHSSNEPSRTSAGIGVAGAGFRPGEEVAVAYVISRQTADQDGTTALQLPPSLVARHGRALLLIGNTSGRVVAAREPLEVSM